MSVTDELKGMTEIALFAGAGGGVLGSKMLGIRTVAYVEWDAFPQAILKARMADGLLEEAPVFGDVREFDTAPYAGKTDIVSGGFPCQPFSTAGRQEADFDPRNMWPATRDIIRGVRPKYAYLENVAGLLTGTHGYFGVVLGELAASGYDVAWTCLPAAAVGAPHRRDRLWILGRRRDGNQSIVPEGTLAEFARFDRDTKAWCRFDGRCRGDTASTVTSYIPFPRSGTVALAPDGTTTVYALDPVAQADGTTRGGWPWPRILEGLRIPDPAASVKDAPVATGVEMMPTPNAFDAHVVGAAVEEAAAEEGVDALDLFREWPTPTASNNRKSKRALTASSDNGRRSGGGQSSPPGLEQAVELAAGIVPKELEGVDPDDLPPATRAMWPTPQASRVSNDTTVRTASQRSSDSPPNKLGWAVGEAEDRAETWPTRRPPTGRVRPGPPAAAPSGVATCRAASPARTGRRRRRGCISRTSTTAGSTPSRSRPTAARSPSPP